MSAEEDERGPVLGEVESAITYDDMIEFKVKLDRLNVLRVGMTPLDLIRRICEQGIKVQESGQPPSFAFDPHRNAPKKEEPPE